MNDNIQYALEEIEREIKDKLLSGDIKREHNIKRFAVKVDIPFTSYDPTISDILTLKLKGIQENIRKSGVVCQMEGELVGGLFEPNMIFIVRVSQHCTLERFVTIPQEEDGIIKAYKKIKNWVKGK